MTFGTFLARILRILTNGEFILRKLLMRGSITDLPSQWTVNPPTQPMRSAIRLLENTVRSYSSFKMIRTTLGIWHEVNMNDIVFCSLSCHWFSVSDVATMGCHTSPSENTPSSAKRPRLADNAGSSVKRSLVCNVTSVHRPAEVEYENWTVLSTTAG